MLALPVLAVGWVVWETLLCSQLSSAEMKGMRNSPMAAAIPMVSA